MKLGLLRTFATTVQPTVQALRNVIEMASFLEITKTLRKVDLCKPEYNGLLHFAVGCGRLDATSFILDSGVDVDQRHTEMEDATKSPGMGPTPSFIAAMASQPHILELLLKRGGNPDLACTLLPADIYHTNITPLHEAAVVGDTEVGKVLFKHGAKPNPQTQAGEVPLLHACWKGHAYMMDLLLDHGADPTIPSTDGKNHTALTFIKENRLLEYRYKTRVLEKDYE